VTDDEFDDFFRETYPRLVAFGSAMSTPLHVAQELAQETMIRADEHRDRLQELDAPYAWCRRVMSNLLIDQHRSRTSERTAIERLGRRTASDRTDATADHTPTETDDAWAEMLAPLTVQQRCIATLYYGEDRSVADIADDLEMSTGSVKTTLSRIRRKVARQLDKPADQQEMHS